MKIRRLRSTIITCRYDAAVRNTHHAWTHKQYLIVAVDADDGATGLGEIYCGGECDPRVIEALLRFDVAPRIVGMDADRIGAVRQRIGAAASLSGRPDALVLAAAGVDTALWDLLGKRTGRPLWQLLGGSGNRVAVYGSGGMYGADITPGSLGEDMSRAIAMGYGGVKIKGAGGSLADDVERVAAVRTAIGPTAKLMVDTMFAPDVPTAIRLARALEPYDLHFLEAPTRAADIRGWAAIGRTTGMALAGPELEARMDVAREFLLHDACHFLQFDVTLAGGIAQGRDLAALAGAFERPVTLHCTASAVGVAASAHLGAALSNCDSLEMHVLHRGLHEHLWSSGWKLADGALTIPDRPGLGLDIDFDQLMRSPEDQ
ncbi:MAG: mandelate racemase/muconate lactonizing enzyme family protein [Burkholderiales bacterium]|nr:mandelate racemase/muconate lactonizing enzyme family protein [Burkholderiales bacterium]